jgi:hypothetical protein
MLVIEWMGREHTLTHAGRDGRNSQTLTACPTERRDESPRRVLELQLLY